MPDTPTAPTPDGPQPEAHQQDVHQHGVHHPAAPHPETVTPAVAPPDVAPPDVAPPDVAPPDVAPPDVALFIRTYSRYGGVEHFCYRFHEYLRAHGVPVRVLCGEMAPDVPGAKAPALRQHSDGPQADPDAAPLAVDIRVLGLWRPGRFMKNLGLHLAATRALRELPPTTISVSFGNMAGCHIHRSGGPHRDFMHNSLAAQRSPLRRFTKALSRLLNPNNLLMAVLDRKIYNHPATRRVIAISQNVRAAVARQFPHSPATVVVIPNGVDTRRFNIRRFTDLRGESRRIVGLREQHRAIGFCSSNFELKGLDRLIAALAHLPEEYVLVVAGGRRSRKYADYAKSLGVEKRVVFLGKVAAADMPRFYAGLDVLCHPSFYDTFGNVVAEAQAMGVPTVTTRATGACDLIDDGRTGRVLDQPEPWALANAIFDLRDVKAGTDFGCVEDDEQVFARYLEVIEAVRAELASDTRG